MTKFKNSVLHSFANGNQFSSRFKSVKGFTSKQWEILMPMIQTLVS